MPDPDDPNELKLLRLMRRGGFKPKQLPKLIVTIDAGIRAEKAKDPGTAMDATQAGRLVRVAAACEGMARLMLKKKLYAAMRAPTAKMAGAPELKDGAGAGDYVALAVVTRIFLIRLFKLRRAEARAGGTRPA